ncbi:MAG TPA: hypothetical protein VFN53_06635, partial [Acidobacteriaceae bacterium]|nr:hypothetical protein [Acidobacteriaceae bacterium]
WSCPRVFASGGRVGSQKAHAGRNIRLLVKVDKLTYAAKTDGQVSKLVSVVTVHIAVQITNTR